MEILQSLQVNALKFQDHLYTGKRRNIYKAQESREKNVLSIPLIVILLTFLFKGTFFNQCHLLIY